jgi:hypothetical protein
MGHQCDVFLNLATGALDGRHARFSAREADAITGETMPWASENCNKNWTPEACQPQKQP